MPEPTLADITDITQLKAMAYDQIAVREQVDRNLQAINGRINELQSEAQPEPEPEPKPVHEGRVTRSAKAPAKK